jgi:hypothetical protein
MNNKELFEIAKETFTKCLGVLENKNHDYAKDSEDALRNFKAVEFFHLTDTSTGIAVRLCDKFMRICNLLHSDAKVKDEKVEDTINDMINYLIILKASRSEKQNV